LAETDVPWLPGYRHSRPVRIGNGAHAQLQLDVFGELADVMYLSRGGAPDDHGWELLRTMLEHLATRWSDPDHGIWEMRTDPRHHTHSKVMAWVAFDRAVRTVEEFREDGPVDRWRALRQQVHDEVCDKAWDPDRHAFTQWYGSKDLDASLLRIPLVGFLPVTDERVQATIETITSELDRGGLLNRFSAAPHMADHSAEEGAFLACSFWLADDLALLGRHDEANAIFERVARLANDVGLLSEEYDPDAGQMLGNFPQALTHVALVNSAINLARAAEGPAHHRARQ
jgi:GH15 family glucan-1,4-alpha-glucosidase